MRVGLVDDHGDERAENRADQRKEPQAALEVLADPEQDTPDIYGLTQL